MNPAVYRDFPWGEVIPYSVAQVVGALLAAVLVYWNYLPAFQAYDPGRAKSAGGDIPGVSGRAVSGVVRSDDRDGSVIDDDSGDYG